LAVTECAQVVTFYLLVSLEFGHDNINKNSNGEDMLKILISLILVMISTMTAFAGSAVVARVNGTDLTEVDLNVEIDRLIPQMSFHRNVTDETRKKYSEKAIEELVVRELQYEDAVSRGIKPEILQLNTQLENFKKKFLTVKEYEAYLLRKGLTEESLKKQFEKDMLINIITAKIVTEPSLISEIDLKKYYEENISKFKQPESLRLRIISSGNENKIKDILAKLKNGEDFADLAATMSEDAYRVKAGDIGYIHMGRMLPELDEAAFKLKMGETSDIIKAQGISYIVKVEDKRPAHVVTFDEIKGKLKKDLESKKARDLREKWISDLKTKAKIEILLKTDSSAGSK
jgi:parvulin-like peptidyl-prolyl isomerase